MEGGFRRIAIVNRGEPAMRLINAVREWRVETGADLHTIALYTRAERRAMFVREADDAVCLDDDRPAGAGSPYLDLVALERALLAGGADAAWVGWGFVAERPEFAELCDRLGIVFVGPSADVMRLLGDKIGAKLLAERAGVPVAPWSGGPVHSLDEARIQAGVIGYPLMIKATAGGGGRGIRRVDAEDGLAEAFESARSEGGKAFGDPTVFMERVVERARHVEVQIIADAHGTVWPCGVRDCSMQRRNQKVFEESQCVAMSAEQDRDLRAAAARLVALAGYVNAGTVEFLYQPDEQRFAFLEVNTRLQVEHPVTELTTGLDLVKLQLHVAAGGRLDGEMPPTEGYAIEARLNAEDPQRGFAPAPGRIHTLVLPFGPGIRVDTGVAEGDVIPAEFDSMIAKVIAQGRTRDEAMSRLHRALSQMTVVIDGGTTNKSFLLDLLERPEVRAGRVDTSWLDQLTATGGHLPTRHGEVALVAAAIDADELLAGLGRDAFFNAASRGRAHADASVGREIELRFAGQSYRLTVRRLGATRYRIEMDGSVVTVDMERVGRGRSRMVIGGTAFAVTSSVQGSDHLVEIDGVAHRCSRDDAGVVRAPAASLVVGIDVEPDQVVAAGDRLGVLEAMKMEIGIAAPIGGRVVQVFVARNVQVDAGAPLFRIEPEAVDGDEASTGDRVGLGAFVRDPDTDEPVELLTTVEALLLGFDVTADEARAALATTMAPSGQRPASARHPAADQEQTVAARELEILEAFADLVALAPERRDVDGADGDMRAPPEHFLSYLRSRDVDREGLPQRFADELLRALAHFDVTTLDQNDELDAALLRLFTSQQRRGEQIPIVLVLLDHVAEGTNDEPRLRAVLDELIERTQRRYPDIANRSRTLRYHRFDRPHIERARADTSARMRELLTSLARPNPSADVIEELVACPLPFLPILAEEDRPEWATDPFPLLEVMTRRYYSIRLLNDIRRAPGGLLAASYDRGNRTVHVLAGGVTGDYQHTLELVDAASEGIVAPDTVVVDLYLASTDGSAGGADALPAALASAELPSVVRRVALIASDPSAGAQVFTFRRPDDDGVRPYWMAAPRTDDSLDDETQEEKQDDEPMRFDEDVQFRGLHPMVARRLQMWRLSNFRITRLPSSADVHVFDCVGRMNESDRRVVAVAEVRDLTPVRDEHGSAVALPDVESHLVACLDAIRDARASDPDLRQLEWNRVMLYVWPPIDLRPEEIRAIARRLAPLTAGYGLEQVVIGGRFVVEGAEPVDSVLRLGYEPGSGLMVRMTPPPDAPMQPLDDYTRKVIQTRRRGLAYPYALLPLLMRTGGSFVEHDLDSTARDGDRLVPVERAPGENEAGVVVGVVSTPTPHHPKGLTRVAVLGDPTRAMGSITEAECRRLLAAIDLAASMSVPIEWFALSGGAKIAMDSGSENLDWVARVLRRLVEHTQDGGEVNIVVAGINVGAQPYWNAESTMLMHTRGILVMTPDSAMVLTGKQAIDYSGGVSAEDNFGIGGYGRVMGPNGEAQYWAPNLAAACDVLFDHYDLTYRAPGERWPRLAPTVDPAERDVRTAPHIVDGVEFRTIGDVFSDVTNPDRKKPFDIRTLMNATIDADHEALERWPEMAEAEMAVVYDARLGGRAISMIGIESRPLPRHGTTPADGPAQWSAGTLFPLSSKKVARAINAASGCRPVVVLANLSGFDGSPESLRRLQLEYGAEIGRAIVNFDGPFVLCVVSRYHGGAFVVFSAMLNDDMEVLAVEGSFASVIGGAPAAAVVFTRDVDERTRSDPRVRALEEALAAAPSAEAGTRRAELAATRDEVRNEKLGEVAAEFDAVHSVERAQAVGSVHRIIPAAALRPELIAAVERGMARVDARLAPSTAT
jgi:acetyl/propionyl-CoA carboxylase alpha subunit/acetyl-CoA carboxylase carboxyltransferase component